MSQLAADLLARASKKGCIGSNMLRAASNELVRLERINARLLASIKSMGNHHDECTWYARPSELCDHCNCQRRRNTPTP